jgi:putative transposase
VAKSTERDSSVVGQKLLLSGYERVLARDRWIDSCRRELLDRTLIWNQRHLMMVLREYEDFYNSHRHRHRALDQAAPLRPLPDGVTDLGHFRVRHDRAGGVIHEYRLVA